MVTGVVAAVLLGLAVPASAHSGSISGSTECFNGEHIVTWHIWNSSQTSTLLMTIVSIDATVGTTSYSVTGYTSPLAKGASTDGTSTVPGGVTGTIDATVHVSWPDGITDTDTAHVTLQDNCNPSTTTTTTSPQTTTTTTVPQTTTTTVPDTTTTTVPDTTTTDVAGTTTIFTTTTTVGPTTTIEGPTTTTPITGLGSTTVVEQATTTVPGSTALPRTGSSPGNAVFFGLSCLAGGALLAIRRRGNWVR